MARHHRSVFDDFVEGGREERRGEEVRYACKVQEYLPEVCFQVIVRCWRLERSIPSPYIFRFRSGVSTCIQKDRTVQSIGHKPTKFPEGDQARHCNLNETRAIIYRYFVSLTQPSRSIPYCQIKFAISQESLKSPCIIYDGGVTLLILSRRLTPGCDERISFFTCTITRRTNFDSLAKDPFDPSVSTAQAQRTCPAQGQSSYL